MTAQTTTPLRSVRRRWPALVGVGFAGLVAFDLSGGVGLAPVLVAAAVVYLGAAALRKPAAAWPLFFATAVVIAGAMLLDGRFDPTWVMLGAGAGLAVYGLLRGASRPAHGLPLQSIAAAGFGAVAVIATLIDRDLGGYLVAAGLLGHAAWDLYHHRTNRVVPRCLAEFCFALDACLGLAVVLVTALR